MARVISSHLSLLLADILRSMLTTTTQIDSKSKSKINIGIVMEIVRIKWKFSCVDTVLVDVTDGDTVLWKFICVDKVLVDVTDGESVLVIDTDEEIVCKQMLPLFSPYWV